MTQRVLCAVGAVVLGGVAVGSQEPIDTDMNWRIRQEATTNSQIMPTLHKLTDVYGPRLTGSPKLAAAGRWAVDQMEAWGLTNGHLEPSDFEHPGWSNERLSVHLVSPATDALVVEAALSCGHRNTGNLEWYDGVEVLRWRAHGFGVCG